MRYPLWLTTALLVVCAGAGQANEAQKQAQMQAAQMQAAQLQASQMQAAQMQYQNQAYLAAMQQQMQQGDQMPAMAGFAGYDAMPATAGDAGMTAQYFMPSSNYAGYAGYNPYAYMYGGYGAMGYYPYYGGQQQPIIIQAPAPQPAKEAEKPKEEPKEEPKKVVTPQPQPFPQPLPTREIVRVQTKTVPERSRPYLGVSGDAALWSPMSYMIDDVTDALTFDKGKPDAFGYGGQAVLGIDCCRFSASSDLGMRFEAELGYNRFGIENETLTNTGAGMGGGTKKDLLATMWSGAVNGYVEYKSGAVHPYVGGGVGGAIGILDVLNTTPDVDFRDGTYMAQAMAGVSVDFGNNLAGNVGYRFRHFGEMGDYDIGDAYKWRLGLENSHAIEAGLRIKF